jgi:Raf kinase inhibitor-like YbhB/YbcL family protein
MKRRRNSLLVAVIAAVSACAPTPAQESAQSTPASEEAPMPEFTLTSSSFQADGEIPSRHTCDGEDVSPALAWEGAPDGTQSLVLVVDDPDARGFVHWVLVDLTASASGSLPEAYAASPDAAQQGTNDFGRVGWGGPCPPSGRHRYTFTLTALNAPLGLAEAPRAEDVRRAMAGRILDEATLNASYQRGG